MSHLHIFGSGDLGFRLSAEEFFFLYALPRLGTENKIDGIYKLQSQCCSKL